MKTIVIDAGHGGKDPGAVNGEHKEAIYALEIAKKAGALLSARGHKILYTRTDDVFVSLEDRAAFSNQNNANIFISVHCNSAANKTAKGVETYHYKGADQISKSIAEKIQKHLVKNTQDTNRGVKEQTYYVLRKTKAKAALVEVGFISHDPTAAKLATENYQNKIAQAIAAGIIELFG